MRLFLDQMFGTTVANGLIAEGHDVVRASEVGLSRADDKEILRRSTLDERILITLDAHFGDWVVLPLSHHFGVVRVKTSPTTSKAILEILIPFFKGCKQEAFIDRLVILSRHKVKWISTAF